MSIANLNTSISTLSGNVDLLIAAEANSVPQSAVDAAQAAVDAVNTKVVAALPPAPPAPTPAG